MKLLKLRERLGGGGEKVEYSLYALGMPRRALRHEDIRLTYAPRWRGNLLSGERERRKGGIPRLHYRELMRNETPISLGGTRGKLALPNMFGFVVVRPSAI